MNVTDKELAVLREIQHSDYLNCDRENPKKDDVVEMPVWSFSVRPACLQGRSFSGVVASLSKKGLVVCDSDPHHSDKSEDTIQMTLEGWNTMQSNAGRIIA